MKQKFRIILILVVISSFAGLSFGQEGTEVTYNSIIEKADGYFRSGDYINAKTSYDYAVRIRPNEEYPKKKLDETVLKLRERMTLIEPYKVAITQADEYFRKHEYDSATLMYKEAAKIFPSEGYSDERIAEIRLLADEKRRNQVRYDDAIYRAEKYVKYNKFSKAIEEYQKALEIFPYEPLPRERIDELAVQSEEYQKTLKEYESIIDNADRLFGLKYFENAKEEYEKASSAKPDEEYPKIKLDEIEILLVEKNKFDQLITDGDDLYMNKELENAKSKYQSALKIYSSDSYAKDMIAKINAAILEQKGPEELYTKSIADADLFLKNDDLINALTEYENAANIKPEEAYPKQKIDEINGLIASIEEDEQNYNLAIKRGEQYLTDSDYSSARIEFEKAREIKPDEKVPEEKLVIVLAALNAQEAVLDSYQLSMDKADKFLEEGDFENAKKEYNSALIIIPGDKTATEKLDGIESLKNQEQAKGLQYSEIITEADQLFADKKYMQAKTRYQEAVDLDDTQSYPSEKLLEIEKLISDNQKIQNDYNKSVATADIYYNNEEYETALAEYRNANLLKPNEQYPLDQINFINDLLEALQDQDKSYADVIKEADGKLGLQNYTEAKLLYMKAANMKPNDLYPKSKIEEIEVILAEQATKQAEYNKLIGAADRMMEAGEYDKAKLKYNEAIVVSPQEQYPKDQLTAIENIILANELEVQNQYNALIVEADEKFVAQEYKVAKQKYQDALKLKPNEAYPVQKMGEIERSSSDLDQLQDNYSRLIIEADRLFSSRELQEAKTKYMEASALFPDEEHPKNRIEEINLAFRADAEKSAGAYDKAIADADKFFAAGSHTQALNSYQQAAAISPDEPHPQQMIEKIMKILDDNAFRKIQTTTLTIQNNEEKKFSFDELEVADRKGSLLVIKAKGIASRNFKVFVSYGRGGSKNGGFSLPVAPSDNTEEFILPVGKQYTWFSKDNNWIKLTPQGGSIEVSSIEIVKE